MPYNSTTSSPALVTPATLVPDPLSLTSFSQSKSIAFIDAGVQDYRSLVTGLSAGTEVVVLDGRMDAVTQITQTLLNRHGIESLQIISHGTNGGLQLGDSWLNAATLPNYVGQLKSWGDALTEDADILLYGCNVAQNATGKAFVNLLAQSTGADVAASNNLTGNAALGGDWDLEFSTGQINQGLSADMSRSAYSSVLDVRLQGFVPGNGSGSSQPLVPNNLVSVNNTIFFTSPTATGIELRAKSMYENTPPNVVYLSGVSASATIGNLTGIKDTLYFTVQSGAETSMWRMRSNTSPTSLGYPGPFAAPERLDIGQGVISNVSQLTRVNDKLFYVSNNALWQVNPPPLEIIGGNLMTTPQMSVKTVLTGSSGTISNLNNVDGTLYFTTSSGGITTLKRAVPMLSPSTTIDGPEMDSQVIATPGSGLSNVTNFQQIGTTLYFTADSAQGRELFRIQNGQTVAQNVFDINPGPASANPSNLTNLNGTLYFSAQDATGKKLWRIGATGNLEIINVANNATNPDPSNLVNANGVLYFIAKDTNAGRTLWRLNPAQGGNFVYQPAMPTTGPNGIIQAVDVAYVDGRIFCTFTEGTNIAVRKLFQFDENPAQSQVYGNQVQLQGSLSSNPSISNFITLNGILYFTTTTNIGETEVWRSAPKPTVVGMSSPSVYKVGVIQGNLMPPGTPMTDRVLSNWLSANGKVFFVADQFTQGKDILTITSQAPMLSQSSQPINYQENGVPIPIVYQAYFDDVDSQSYKGGSIIIGNSLDVRVGDRFTIAPSNNPQIPISLDGRMIKYANQRVGTYTGGIGRQLVVNFDTDKDISRDVVKAVLNQLVFSSTAEILGGNRSIQIQLDDGEGGRGSSTVNIFNNNVDDLPIVGIRRDFPIPAFNEWVFTGPQTALGGSYGSGLNTLSNLTDKASFSLKTDLVPQPSGYSLANTPQSTKISMESASGFVVNFELEVFSDIRSNGTDLNLDGFDDQAGFSFLVVSSDPTKAIELGFFGDRIGAMEDDLGQSNPGLSADPSNPTRTLFTQAEGIGFNTHRLVRYTLAVKGDTYTLYGNNQVILNGRLRNYSNATNPTIAGINSYTVANTISLSDNSAVAGANVRLGIVSVVGVPIVNETVIDEASANGGTFATIGQLDGFDLDNSNIQTGYNNPLNVSVVAAPGNQFSWVNNTSVLSGTRLDYEAQTSYVARVSALNSGMSSVERDLIVRLRNADDRARLVVPAGQTMLEDGVITFNAANGNAIKLTDVDQSVNVLDVTLAVYGGELTRPAILNAVNWSTQDLGSYTNVYLHGSLTEINNTLTELTYRPWQNANTPVGGPPGFSPHQITVSLSENNTSSGPAKQIYINVTAVNDAPDFTIGANQVVTAGTGLQSITGWASQFKAIAAASLARPYDNESAQSVASYKVVSNDRPDLFDGTIVIDPTGKLSFKTVGVLMTSGVATIAVRVRDNGGTANGGVDLSTVKIFTITVNPAPPSAWTIAAQADFDRDGKADILWHNEQTGANVIWKMGANGVETPVGLQTVGDLNWQIIGAADFNGDGKIDILWQNKVTGWANYWQMNDLAVQQSVVLPTVSDLNFKVAAIADFDQDGKADIMWRNQTNGWNVIWKMGATGFQQSIGLTSVPIDWQVAGVADFDGDGKVDIMWRNQVNGANVVWKMNGMAQQQSFVLDTVADTNFQVAGIADFDGDGKVDILWRNKTTGQVSIWKMNGVVKQAAIALPIVSDPDFQISGIKDVDGDGKLDIVWRNKRTSQNVLWKMNDMNVSSITGITSV
jgi:ELWxxDGT repeat protein